MENWREMDTAPIDEPVLVVLVDCHMVVAKKINENLISKTGKNYIWVNPDWYPNCSSWGRYEPKMWQPLPLPPKHLYERKLLADNLEKQLEELRK